MGSSRPDIEFPPRLPFLFEMPTLTGVVGSPSQGPSQCDVQHGQVGGPLRVEKMRGAGGEECGVVRASVRCPRLAPVQRVPESD